MTKKDFNLIAAVLHDELSSPLSVSEALTIEYAAIALAEAFQDENPRFDMRRFIAAVMGDITPCSLSVERVLA